MGVSVESKSLGTIPVSELRPGQFAVVTSANSDVVGHIIYKTGAACSTKLIDLTIDDGWSGDVLPTMMVRVLEPGTMLKVK